MAAYADTDAAAPAPSAEDTSAEEIRTLIEQLNNAIEQVNELEDAHQACCARHAATLRALTCGMASLEAESKGTKWQAAAIAAAEACEAAAAAQQQLAAAEQLQVVDATAAKMVASVRKAASNAASREEKARRNLERLHGHEGRRWTGAPSSHVPWEEELAVVSRWLVMRDEVRKARQMETLELGESELLKEAAAAAVNEAMAALEEKSDEIHKQQTAEAAVRASEGGGKRIRGSTDEGGEGGKESAAEGERGSLVKKAGSSSRSSVALLLGRAREYTSPISEAGLPCGERPYAASTALFEDYAIDPWHGLVWVDTQSIHRSQAEDAQVEAQYL